MPPAPRQQLGACCRTSSWRLGRLAPGADIAAAAAVLVGICHDRVLNAVLPGMSPPAVESAAVVAALLDGIGPRA
ncbi:hypothetical protein [Nocardia tengchongensis]